MYGLSTEIDPVIETTAYNPVRLMVRKINTSTQSYASPLASFDLCGPPCIQRCKLFFAITHAFYCSL